MKINEALDWATNEIEKANVKGPKSSARLLLSYIIKKDFAYMMTHFDRELGERDYKNFENAIKRRLNHEPVWHIMDNNVNFFGRDFYVDENVLIPRPETEIMLEMIISEFKKRGSFRALDIGTGSGAIAVTLAGELKNGKFFASDISQKAIEVAKKNSTNNKISINFKEGCLFEPWKNESFDLIVTNLPYIPHEDLPYLDKDVTQYEPLLALDGGKEGLEIYNNFFENAPRFLEENGMIFCEIGHDQGSRVVDLAKRFFPNAKVELILDYAGKDRIVIVQS